MVLFGHDPTPPSPVYAEQTYLRGVSCSFIYVIRVPPPRVNRGLRAYTRVGFAFVAFRYGLVFVGPARFPLLFRCCMFIMYVCLCLRRYCGWTFFLVRLVLCVGMPLPPLCPLAVHACGERCVHMPCATDAPWMDFIISLRKAVAERRPSVCDEREMLRNRACLVFVEAVRAACLWCRWRMWRHIFGETLFFISG